MNDVPSTWLLLVTNLPGRNPTLRMRVWRALKGGGAGLLRDGVYVLPSFPSARQAFETQAAQIKAAGGLAQVLSCNAESGEQHASFAALFDRTAEYEEVVGELESLKRELGRIHEQEARQRLASIVREMDVITARDFFPGEAQAQVRRALADAQALLNARFSPGEPHGKHLKIRRYEQRDYTGRTWATRERLWVDRVASAWLIRRFIDPRARFLWLKRLTDRPKRAVGFDFDGAEFSHVDSKVTFEVLVASFGLEQDGGLTRLGALVHHLDVGGIPTAESAGFATVMTGARALHPTDDALLAAMSPVLDSLYAAYSGAEKA